MPAEPFRSKQSICCTRSSMAATILFAIITSAMAAPVQNLTINLTINNESMEVITRFVSPREAPDVELVPDIVITLAVIAACAGIGIGIAKCADIVYDRHIAQFSKKEINDNTRKLLRARVAIMRMKADPKASELRFAKRAASRWMSRTAGKKETVDPKNASAANEIGTTHVPGIQIDVEELKPTDGSTSSGEGKARTEITKLPAVAEHDKIVTFPQIERVPLEVTTMAAMKPGGRLPPVVVHDSPK